MTVLRSNVALVALLATAGCASLREPVCAPGEERYVSHVMYFGSAKPTGVVTSEEWAEFLRTSVTPRFPQGFTVWEASGQWQGADGAIVRETSFVLSLVHPDDEEREGSVRAIAAEYKSRFHQEAVLHVKSHACASF